MYRVACLPRAGVHKYGAAGVMSPVGPTARYLGMHDSVTVDVGANPWLHLGHPKGQPTSLQKVEHASLGGGINLLVYEPRFPRPARHRSSAQGRRPVARSVPVVARRLVGRLLR